ncbi:MAG: hypothetical protein LBJ63_01655 [Prevotellaceae bacterium]|jgi:hypothetical protein|nr:hypothetical protein [Prevotellaceae bacterium]
MKKTDYMGIVYKPACSPVGFHPMDQLHVGIIFIAMIHGAKSQKKYICVNLNNPCHLRAVKFQRNSIYFCREYNLTNLSKKTPHAGILSE